MGLDEREDGWRSNVSGPLVLRAAEDAGLEVLRQAGEWGEDSPCPATAT